MNILEKILAHKRTEVQERKSLYPTKLLEQSIYFETKPVSLRKYLLREDLSGIIAEFKRQSPSKGAINAYAKPEKVTLSYMQAGASALSVLTDQHFFGGSTADLQAARTMNYCPILRKDFVVDEYQVLEAKSIGADAILLIANALDADNIKALAALAASLGMEVLFEVHRTEELAKLNEHIGLVGVNNRNLEDFSVDIQQSLDVLPHIPAEMVRVSESGISKPEAIATLKAAGFNGFLIGEAFMKHADPGQACNRLIQAVRQQTNQAKANA